MAWRAVVDSEPEFAQRVQTTMDAHRHKTLATLRADGSPRISGIGVSFVASERWAGDAKLSGDPQDHLVIELWRPDRPLHRVQRR